MSDEFSLRRYEPADAERVWEVHERALRASPIPFVEDTPADQDLTEITAQYLASGGEFLVGLADDELVAIGGFQPRQNGTVELRRMRVHPDYQGRGYGDRLLETLEDRAREQGVSRIVLETNEQLTAARQLYEKHGYEESERTHHPETGDTFVSYRKRL